MPVPATVSIPIAWRTAWTRTAARSPANSALSERDQALRVHAGMIPSASSDCQPSGADAAGVV